ASAGGNQSGIVGQPVNLSAAGSTDVDGDPLTYRWSFVSTPNGSAAALSDPNAKQPSFTPDVPGAYQVQVIVNDGALDSQPAVATATVVPVGTLTLTPDHLDVITYSTAALSLTSNIVAGPSGLKVTLTSTNSDLLSLSPPPPITIGAGNNSAVIGLSTSSA